MSLRQMVEKVFGFGALLSPEFQVTDAEVKALKRRDSRPVEVSPRLALPPVSSLDDMRKAIEIISREKEAAGGETFEEFWDFGSDDEFADMESMPAPAQLKAASIMEAFTKDFEADIAAAQKVEKEKAREVLKAELRAELAADLEKVKRVPAAGEAGTDVGT